MAVLQQLQAHGKNNKGVKMKIIKLLMCIAMLFIVACDSDSDNGGLTVDDLQGTWDITNICF